MDHQFARRGGRSGADEGDARRRDRLRARREAMFVVFGGGFARPETRLRKDMPGAPRAQPVAHKLRRRNETTAIITDIDDEVGAALTTALGNDISQREGRRRAE